MILRILRPDPRFEKGDGELERLRVELNESMVRVDHAVSPQTLKAAILNGNNAIVFRLKQLAEERDAAAVSHNHRSLDVAGNVRQLRRMPAAAQGRARWTQEALEGRMSVGPIGNFAAAIRRSKHDDASGLPRNFIGEQHSEDNPAQRVGDEMERLPVSNFLDFPADAFCQNFHRQPGGGVRDIQGGKPRAVKFPCQRLHRVPATPKAVQQNHPRAGTFASVRFIPRQRWSEHLQPIFPISDFFHVAG